MSLIVDIGQREGGSVSVHVAGRRLQPEVYVMRLDQRRKDSACSSLRALQLSPTDLLVLLQVLLALVAEDRDQLGLTILVAKEPITARC